MSASKQSNSALLPPDGDLEIFARRLEKASSRNPFPGRQGTKLLIDGEILAGFADPDEIAHEEQASRTFDGEFQRADDIAVSDMSGEGCECDDGEQCQVCCTSQDLMGIPHPLFHEESRKQTPTGVDIYISLPEALARRLGLI